MSNQEETSITHAPAAPADTIITTTTTTAVANPLPPTNDTASNAQQAAGAASQTMTLPITLVPPPVAATIPSAVAVAAAAAAAEALATTTTTTPPESLPAAAMEQPTPAAAAAAAPAPHQQPQVDSSTTAPTAHAHPATAPHDAIITPTAAMMPCSVNFQDPLPFCLKPMAPILHTLKQTHVPDTPASTPFPSDYQPRMYDICNGRGKSHWNMPGNKAFRKYVQVRVYDYMQVESKVDKTKYVQHCVKELRTLGFRFLRETTPGGGAWYDLGDAVARNKVGHSLRDQVAALRKADNGRKVKATHNSANKSASKRRKSMAVTHPILATPPTEEPAATPNHTLMTVAAAAPPVPASVIAPAAEEPAADPTAPDPPATDPITTDPPATDPTTDNTNNNTAAAAAAAASDMMMFMMETTNDTTTPTNNEQPQQQVEDAVMTDAETSIVKMEEDTHDVASPKAEAMVPL